MNICIDICYLLQKPLKREHLEHCQFLILLTYHCNYRKVRLLCSSNLIMNNTNIYIMTGQNSRGYLLVERDRLKPLLVFSICIKMERMPLMKPVFILFSTQHLTQCIFSIAPTLIQMHTYIHV